MNHHRLLQYCGRSSRPLQTARLPSRLSWSSSPLSSRKRTRRALSTISSAIADSLLAQRWPELVEQFRAAQDEDGYYPLFRKSALEAASLRLQKKTSTHNHPPSSPNKQAAVLVLLCSVDQEPSVLFTKRSSDLTQHAAEISFPGGHWEPGDAGLTQTALREAEEELAPQLFSMNGNESNDSSNNSSSNNNNNNNNNNMNKPPLDLASHVQILGPATPLPSLRGTPVTPIVGALWHDLSNDPNYSPHNNQNNNNNNTIANTTTNHYIPTVFPGDPAEVEAVFCCSIAALAAAETSRPLPQNRFGLAHGPVFPTTTIMSSMSASSSSNGHGNIWGLTAYILRPLLHSLLKPVFLTEHGKEKGQEHR